MAPNETPTEEPTELSPQPEETQEIEQGKAIKKPTKRGRYKPGNNRNDPAAEGINSEIPTERPTPETHLTKAAYRRFKQAQQQPKTKEGVGERGY